jgi:ribosome-associated protein
MPHESTVLEITPAVSVRLSELHFKTSRSGGPGGQNVNKLETRVELVFNILDSRSLNEDQKRILLAHLSTRIDADGNLHISAQKSRSQWENKQLAIEKFVALLRTALHVRKKRVKTAPTASSRERRVQNKKRHSRKKSLRKVKIDDQ